MRLFLAMILIAASMVGCTRGGTQQQQAKNDGVHVQQSAPEVREKPDWDDVNRLEALAKSIPQVYDAKCVVMGKTAIVGLTIDPALERSKVNTIKFSVAEAFRKDPAGINAIVTADIGIAQRIHEVRDDIKNGRPFAGFAQELGDIIGRAIPQLPRDIQPMDDHRHEDPDAKNFQNNNL